MNIKLYNAEGDVIEVPAHRAEELKSRKGSAWSEIPLEVGRTADRREAKDKDGDIA